MKNFLKTICAIFLLVGCNNTSNDKFVGTWICTEENKAKPITIKKLKNNTYQLKFGNTTGTTDIQNNPNIIKYYSFIFKINNSGNLTANGFSRCNEYKKK